MPLLELGKQPTKTNPDASSLTAGASTAVESTCAETDALSFVYLIYLHRKQASGCF